MYDYIITGAGPAGCVLARRLSDDPAVKVLLVEAGGRDWHPLVHMPAGFAKMTKGIASWGWSTVPQKHLNDRVLWYTQAKVIGGGSSINAQVYARGNAADYDGWATEEGCTGWSYREMEEAGVSLPVIEAHCEYRQPARYDDEIDISTAATVLTDSRNAAYRRRKGLRASSSSRYRSRPRVSEATW